MVLKHRSPWSAILITLGMSLLTACGGPKLAQKLEPLEGYFQQQVDEKKTPGVVVLVRRTDRDDTYVKAVGKLDIDQDKPLPEDALFRIASMTKPITSVAVMMLVDDGKLGLDDPISKYLPEWQSPQVVGKPDPANPGASPTTPAKTPITVKHLLTHTSGISYPFKADAVTPFYKQAGITNGLEHTRWTLAQESQALAALPLLHEPGSAFTYGLSTDLLGHLIETVSGQPLDQFFEERIFKPLGMKDTTFFLSPEQASRLVTLYRHTPAGSLERVPATETNTVEGHFSYAPDFQYAGSKTYRSGGAGLVSTAADYARFLQMIANGGEYGGVRLLKKETVDLMTSNQLGNLKVEFFPISFGLGFAVQDNPELTKQLGPLGSYFWSGIFNTSFWVSPQEKVLGVVMTQSWDPENPVTSDIQARISAALAQ
ncbi:serine hydrolase domain-containing protein [Hyalangium versicolor]|uniref:serine hydrolase domain-containing protein n=1 Tax=Hyalangium versicolor TaxID=2861190 RepID=UPI001CCAA598|nr:serine hydrolase domain-containing protein [Hyalangium versicolor]